MRDSRRYPRPPDRAARPRLCAKRGYTTEISARIGAQYRLGQPECLVDQLWVYQCTRCNGWHLTRSSNATAPVTHSR